MARILLAERSIWLSSGWRLVHVRIGSRGQAIGLLLLCALVGWAIRNQVVLLEYEPTLAAEMLRADTYRRAYEMIDGDVTALQDQIQDLRNELGQRNYELGSLSRGANDLQQDLAAAWQRLDDALHERDSALRDGRLLADRVYRLESRLYGRPGPSRNLVERLNDRGEQSLQDLELAFSLAGIDPDRLLRQAELTTPAASGGPLLSLGARRDGRAAASGDPLALKLGRWAALQAALGRLPIHEPVQGAIVSGFGPRNDPLTGLPAMHSGIDIAGRIGAPVQAAAPGTVAVSGAAGAYGQMVEIDHGFGIRSRYGHLRDILVRSGERVQRGAVIGTIGNSGRSTGPHLHFEVLFGDEAFDPAKFLEAGRYVFKDVKVAGGEGGRQ